MKYSYYYWLTIKDSQPTLQECNIFMTRDAVAEAFIERITRQGYEGNIPSMHWEREPENVFESVLVCQLLFDGLYFEIRQIAIDTI